mmetsp:Transcript_3022/g.7632  ORF Transcript_3022/g.7632 Transcript_3022/m.7632 type:complete len:253 (-) Transcript_3022:195-953(-)
MLPPKQYTPRLVFPTRWGRGLQGHRCVASSQVGGCRRVGWCGCCLWVHGGEGLGGGRCHAGWGDGHRMDGLAVEVEEFPARVRGILLNRTEVYDGLPRDRVMDHSEGERLRGHRDTHLVASLLVGHESHVVIPGIVAENTRSSISRRTSKTQSSRPHSERSVGPIGCHTHPGLLVKQPTSRCAHPDGLVGVPAALPLSEQMCVGVGDALGHLDLPPVTPVDAVAHLLGDEHVPPPGHEVELAIDEGQGPPRR